MRAMLMHALSQRDLRPERMDQPDLAGDQHAAALRGLARINRVSGTARHLWSRLRGHARAAGSRLHVLDVATGAGDVPAAIARLAAREGVTLRVTALDISPRAVSHARQVHGDAVHYAVADALRDPLPGADVAMACLFLHHLDRLAAVQVMQRLREAASRVIVDDLERSRLGLALAWAGTRVLSRCDVVHEDGPQSVRAAFTVGEVRAMAEEAGLHGATVERRWPCRWTLDWRRP